MENDIDELQRTQAGLIHEVLGLKLRMKWVWRIQFILGAIVVILILRYFGILG